MCCSFFDDLDNSKSSGGDEMKKWIKNIIWWVMFRVAAWMAEDEVKEELDVTEEFYHE